MNNLDYISQLNMERLPLPTIDNNDINSFADLSFFDFDSSFNLKGSVAEHFTPEFVQPQDIASSSPAELNTPYNVTTDSTPAQTPGGSFGITNEVDKKKRNTAASARFRIKKKLREQEMEKTLKQLTERISGYNSKIQQLEMENQCLKSLIIEKNEKKSNDLLRSIKLKSTFSNTQSF